jgi:DNA invertase Pin-like site-specific DNA recombinase
VAKHTAIYIRVSSKRQDTKSQEPDLQKWAGLHADDSDVVFYRDKFTGKTMDWTVLGAQQVVSRTCLMS